MGTANVWILGGYQSDFGDTTTIMLTVASPRIGDVEIALRARSVRQAIERVRRSRPSSVAGRVAAIYSFPQSISAEGVRQGFGRFVETAVRDGICLTTIRSHDIPKIPSCWQEG